MKPFDLEKAVQGYTVIYRNGKEARFVGYIPEAKKKLCVVSVRSGKSRYPILHCNKGRVIDPALDHDWDLMMEGE